MRDIKTFYWLMFLAWKIGALVFFLATNASTVASWVLFVSLVSSIPWWIYVYDLWPRRDDEAR